MKKLLSFLWSDELKIVALYFCAILLALAIGLGAAQIVVWVFPP